MYEVHVSLASDSPTAVFSSHGSEGYLIGPPAASRERHKPATSVASDSDMTDQTQEMIDFIVREILRKPGVQIADDTALVSSGLVDSLALVDILVKLEQITGRRIPPGQVEADQMNTVSLMLATAERIGKPKKVAKKGLQLNGLVAADPDGFAETKVQKQSR